VIALLSSSSGRCMNGPSYLNVVFQRHFGTRAVTEYLGNGFDWRPVVVQPRTETTTECVKPCHSTPVPCNVFLIIFDPRVAKSRGKTCGPSKTHVVPGFCFRCFFSSAITFGKRCTLAVQCSVFVSMTCAIPSARRSIGVCRSRCLPTCRQQRVDVQERLVGEFFLFVNAVQETLNIGCRTSRKPEPANARLNLWALYKFTYPFTVDGLFLVLMFGKYAVSA